MEFIEVSAKTVDDAITEACQKLTVTSDKLEYEVVEEGSAGFLGIGAKPAVIKASGIDCVIAKTFARIFYRNAINIGLPILECPEASEAIEAGQEVSIDFDTGVIVNETTGEKYQAQPFPEFIKDIMAKGGLMKSIKG